MHNFNRHKVVDQSAAIAPFSRAYTALLQKPITRSQWARVLRLKAKWKSCWLWKNWGGGVMLSVHTDHIGDIGPGENEVDQPLLASHCQCHRGAQGTKSARRTNGICHNDLIHPGFEFCFWRNNAISPFVCGKRTSVWYITFAAVFLGFSLFWISSEAR